MNKARLYLILLLLVLADFAAFGRIMTNGFVDFDDKSYLTHNIHIQSGFTGPSIKWALTSTFFWHPITWFSHMLDWKLFGANAAGHHFVSLLLHTGAVLLLFLLLNGTTRDIWPAAFAAAFFALHPLRVESVAWAAERKDVLSMFFGLACLNAYAGYCRQGKRTTFFLVLVLLALALMSKSTMVTLPIVMLLLDYWPLNRFQKGPAGGIIREKIPLLCLSVISGAITIWGQHQDGAVASLGRLPFPNRLGNAIVSGAAYLGKIFLPLNLAVYYPYVFHQPVWKILVSAAVLLVITAAAVYAIRRLPFLFVGWAWYLITLTPLIGIIQVGSQAMADRYTYLPSAGIAITMAWGLPALIRGRRLRRLILPPAGIMSLVLLSVLTWRQCGYWRNTVTLFCHAARVTTDNCFAHTQCGAALLAAGNATEAIGHLDKAIRLEPDYAEPYYHRGVADAALGLNHKAAADLSEAIRRESDPRILAAIYRKRDAVYAGSGVYSQAIDDLSQSLRLKNDCAEAYHERGELHADQGCD